MTQKLTKKDKLTAIIATLKGENTDITVDELVAYCENEIELLDKKAAKAKETAAKKKAENDELTDVIASLLTDELQTREQIFAKVEGEDLTIAKIGARLTQLCANGEARKEQIKVEDRKVMAYALVTEEADAE